MREYEIFRDGEKTHAGKLGPTQARKERNRERRRHPESRITIRDARTRAIVHRIVMDSTRPGLVLLSHTEAYGESASYLPRIF